MPYRPPRQRLRSLVPYLLPVVIGVLLAVVLLNAFPQLSGRDAADSAGAASTLPRPCASRWLPYPPTWRPPATRPSAPHRNCARAPPLAREQGPASYAAAVERAAPAVVNIYPRGSSSATSTR